MKKGDAYLSKREQQIMELVYARGQITSTEATELLPGEPANSTVRTLLKILEEKGQLKHTVENGKYIFTPVKAPKSAAKSALKKVVETFYKGSVGEAFVALLSEGDTKLSADEVMRLEELIQKAKEGGR